MRTIFFAWLAAGLVWATSGCGGDSQSVPDADLSCDGHQDCLEEGYICNDGQCVEACRGTDFDGDGYCDDREGFDDCNDNRADIHPGADELCDGVDNDCDAVTDEDCPCAMGDEEPCGIDTGICRKGTRACQGGQWGECRGSTEPEEEENCDDDLDNDCNGSVNDGCACAGDGTRSCGSDLGECTEGVQTCGEIDGEWLWSGCQGGNPPVDEVCGDDLDNDCEGAIDLG